MDVDIQELQQRLSEYLQHVRAGLAVRVIDCGVPLAMITPVSTGHPLQRGIDEGWIRPPQRTGRLGVIERAKGARRIADVLAEDRDD